MYVGKAGFFLDEGARGGERGREGVQTSGFGIGGREGARGEGARRGGKGREGGERGIEGQRKFYHGIRPFRVGGEHSWNQEEEILSWDTTL